MLPTIHVEAESDADDVAKVAAILGRALPGFDAIEYVARPHQPGGDDDPVDFEFMVTTVPGEAEVHVQLQHEITSRILATREIDPLNAEDEIADMLTSAAVVSGSIYAFVANNELHTDLTRCLLLSEGYYRDPDEQSFRDAYECVAALEDTGLRSPLICAELASLQMQGIVNHYEYAADFTRETAIKHARRAIQTGPTSSYAHRSYGYIAMRLGNEDEGLEWMRKAYELSPYDLTMAASFAYALVFSGEYEEPAPILERAVRVASSHPNWWDYALFLAMFMLGEDDEAANATVALETTMRAHYLAARMIVAHKAGDTDEADRLRAQIVEKYPVFAADPRTFYEEAQYPADMTGKLVEAINAAGLVSDS